MSFWFQRFYKLKYLDICFIYRWLNLSLVKMSEKMSIFKPSSYFLTRKFGKRKILQDKFIHTFVMKRILIQNFVVINGVLHKAKY